MGASVVNALSSHLHVQVDQDGFSYAQSYERGIPAAPVKQLGPCSPGTHGTTVTFMPDQDIFLPLPGTGIFWRNGSGRQRS